MEVADLIDKGEDGGCKPPFLFSRLQLRNDQGNPLLAGALNLRSNTINVSEALALREAITWARRKTFSHIIVKGDSKLIIDVVQGKCQTPWNLRSILEDIKWCDSSFQEVRWNHVFRKANFLVDALASVGIKMDNLHIWDACIPMEASNALLFEASGTGCTRGSYV